MAGEQRHALQAEVRSLFSRAKMPSSPALATEVLRLIKDHRSGARDFGRVIGADAALTGRLLKTANSAHYAQRLPVSTIERAVTVLGLNRVKSIALGFQLVAHLDRVGGAPFDLHRFWQESLLRACFARAVAARVVSECMDEAFLVGLLEDCGKVILVQVMGGAYATLCKANLSPTAFFSAEQVSFTHTHAEAIAALADEWRLPEVIARPLARHHRRPRCTPPQSNADWLDAVAYFAGGMRFGAQMKVDPEEVWIREFGQRELGLVEEVWSDVLREAEQGYRQVAPLYEGVLPENADVTDLLAEANEQLTSAIDDADRRVFDVESERTVIQQEQQRLAEALRDYRERAALDPLTNVLNRGGLTDVLQQLAMSPRETDVPAGVLFADIDDFKALNDTYGHRVGDEVLRAIARVMTREVGDHGEVGRYGGEEFVAVVAGLTPEQTRGLGDRIVQSVREMDTRACGADGRVTISLGTVCYDGAPLGSPDCLLVRADQLMYKAKRGGKDRQCFEHVSSIKSAPAPSVADSDAGRSRGAVSGPEGEMADGGRSRLLAIARRLNAAETGAGPGVRKQQRKALIVPCVLHCFTGAGTAVRSVDAATRNITTGGLGAVTDVPLTRGEAVEVVLDQNGSKVFLAGLAAFCREIEPGAFEVGVQFVIHSVRPILSQNATRALEQHDWIARALNAKQTGELAAAPG